MRSVELPQTDADVILLAGDIGYGKQAIEWAAEVAQIHGKPVVMVAGNHEYYGHIRGFYSENVNHNCCRLLETLRETAEPHRVNGLYFLEQDAMEIKETRVLGCTLWTDFLGRDDMAIRQYRKYHNDFNYCRYYSHTEAGTTDFNALVVADIYNESVAWLASELATPYAGDIVVLSHHAPSYCSALKKRQHDPDWWEVLPPAYCSDLESLIIETAPRLWVHGHVHITNNYRLGQTQIVSNPLGRYHTHPPRGFEWDLVIDTSTDIDGLTTLPSVTDFTAVSEQAIVADLESAIAHLHD